MSVIDPVSAPDAPPVRKRHRRTLAELAAAKAAKEKEEDDLGGLTNKVYKLLEPRTKAERKQVLEAASLLLSIDAGDDEDDR